MTEQELEREKARLNAAAHFMEAEVARFAEACARHYALHHRFVRMMWFHTIFCLLTGFISGAAAMKMWLLQ